MATKVKKRAVRARRSNAERTAETRGKLIEAAIDSLYRFGYSATTTIEVADRAKVSRGAMLHHFPTRVKLLLAVAEHTVTTQRDTRRAKLGALSGLARFDAAADVNWEVQKEPSTIALLEIMMASRSDRALRKGLMPFFNLLPKLRADAASYMAEDLGLPAAARTTQRLADMLHIHMAALRGLAIELLFTDDPQEIERARRLLQRYDRSIVDELLKENK